MKKSRRNERKRNASYEEMSRIRVREPEYAWWYRHGTRMHISYIYIITVADIHIYRYIHKHIYIFIYGYMCANLSRVYVYIDKKKEDRGCPASRETRTSAPVIEDYILCIHKRRETIDTT